MSRFVKPDSTRVDRSDAFGVAVRALWNEMGMHCSDGRACWRDEEGVRASRCGSGCVEIFEEYVADFALSKGTQLRAYHEQRPSSAVEDTILHFTNQPLYMGPK